MTITLEHGKKYITRGGATVLAAKIADDKFAVRLPGGMGGVVGADGRFLTNGRDSEHDIVAAAE